MAEYGLAPRIEILLGNECIFLSLSLLPPEINTSPSARPWVLLLQADSGTHTSPAVVLTSQQLSTNYNVLMI